MDGKDVANTLIHNLLQLGFIARTPRGRVLLKDGYKHIGLTPPDDKE